MSAVALLTSCYSGVPNASDGSKASVRRPGSVRGNRSTPDTQNAPRPPTSCQSLHRPEPCILVDMGQIVFTGTIDPQMERAAQILAKMSGRVLATDNYQPGQDGHLFPLSKSELQLALRALEVAGLAASVLERLEGRMWALTERGRRLAESQGFIFDPAEIERTRELFSAHLNDGLV